MASGIAAKTFSGGIVALARVLLSLRAVDLPLPDRGEAPAPRIYVANHVSHADFVALWSVLPGPVRARTRPVAGADYWRATALKRWIADQVFNAILIERNPANRQGDPLEAVTESLRKGEDVIFFPEGTRNLTDARLLPLKSGIYHLARAVPGAEVVPAWILNLDRILPKGAILPVPLNCAVVFGPPLRPGEDEPKEAFLTRLSTAMLELADRGART